MSRERHTTLSLAQELGVTEQAISDWLHGKYLPSTPKLPLIARALHVEVTDVRRAVLAARDERASARASTAISPAVTP